MTRPLHEQEPTTRFSDRAIDYARHRPGYPSEAIDAVLEGMGDSRALVAADVGAGTGISAALLAERGVRVHAVEPNEAMRRASLPHERVSWRAGSAESTGLDPGSVDLVLCAQSYHWFKVESACIEFGRVLKPGGRLALMWNDGDESDPVAKGYYDLVREASTGAGPSSHQTVAKAPRIAAPFEAGSTRCLKFRNAQRVDEDGLVGRAMSASYVPKRGEAAERLERGLRALHGRHAASDGTVDLVYTVFLYLTGRP